MTITASKNYSIIASKNHSIKKLLKVQGFVLLDGALATELEARGADLRHALWSAKILVERPEMIRAVHLDYLRAGGTSTTLNCGYGHGYSVKEVIDAVQRCHGAPLSVEYTGRRAGDPAILVSNVEKIHSTLDWNPHHDDLDTIVATSLAWEKKLHS